MARQTKVQLIDDIDGSPADESVTFALDGVTYEIDLAAAHAAKLRKALEPYVSSARRIAGRKQRGKRASQLDTAAIRQWATDNGYELSDRGRIPRNVVEAYQAAQSKAA